MKVRVTRSDSDDIYLHYTELYSKLTVRMSEDEAQDLMNDLLKVLNGRVEKKENVLPFIRRIDP